MSNKRYWVEESCLTNMADIIRHKTGIAEKLTFPDEFLEGILNIKTTPDTTLPVLDPNYPEDVTVVEADTIVATFITSISIPGVPAEYTYQWFMDGVAIEGATDSSWQFSGNKAEGTYNVYCRITNEAGTVVTRVSKLKVESCLPTFTYSNTNFRLNKESNYNWNIEFLSTGNLTFTSLGSATSIDMFQVGGGGAGAKPSSGSGGAAVGGGGAYRTVNGIVPNLNANYTITIGAGGDTNGETGGTTSAFNYSSNGGGGGKAGTTSYALVNLCSSSGSAGNLYVYDNLTSNTNTSYGSGYHDVELVYPYVSEKHNNGVTVYLGRDGYWYRTNEVYFTLKTIYNSAGVAGSGSSATRIFGTGNSVSGPGSTNSAINYGQGGGSFNIVGGNGLVVIRNHR